MIIYFITNSFTVLNHLAHIFWTILYSEHGSIL